MKINEKLFDSRINYCGTFERQAFFTKWVPLHLVYKGINRGCYMHDCRYSYVFDKRRKLSLMERLRLKIRADFLFLREMIHFSLKNTQNPLKVIQRVGIAILFFLIVLLGTPYYYFVFRKRKNKFRS